MRMHIYISTTYRPYGKLYILIKYPPSYVHATSFSLAPERYYTTASSTRPGISKGQRPKPMQCKSPNTTLAGRKNLSLTDARHLVPVQQRLCDNTTAWWKLSPSATSRRPSCGGVIQKIRLIKKRNQNFNEMSKTKSICRALCSHPHAIGRHHKRMIEG